MPAAYTTINITIKHAPIIRVFGTRLRTALALGGTRTWFDKSKICTIILIYEYIMITQREDIRKSCSPHRKL